MAQPARDPDMIAFGIIASSGDARSQAFLALQAAQDGKFEEAEELLKKAKASGARAHQEQTQLLFDEINGKPATISLLMVHAQDHLMTSMLAQELIEGMVESLKKQAETDSILRKEIASLQAALQKEADRPEETDTAQQESGRPEQRA